MGSQSFVVVFGACRGGAPSGFSLCNPYIAQDLLCKRLVRCALHKFIAWEHHEASPAAETARIRGPMGAAHSGVDSRAERDAVMFQTPHRYGAQPTQMDAILLF